MKPILLLDCYLDARGAAGNFLPLLDELPVRVVRPAHHTSESWAIHPGDHAGVIITGSAASACQLSSWALALADLVREFAARDQPMLGVCFGHQIIARALLGPRAVRPAPAPEVGFFDVEVTGQDPLLDGLGRGFRVFVSHLEEVAPSSPDADSPDEAQVGASHMRVLARTRRCANHAFRMGDRPIWGVQFHAEIGHDEARELVHAKARAHPELGLVPADALAGAVDGQPIFRRIMDNFLAAL